jgi:Family of unknown function (DUF6498)
VSIPRQNPLNALAPALAAIGINAVPAFGFFASDWTIATTMLVYLLDNLIGVTLTSGRIWLLVDKNARYDPANRPAGGLPEGMALTVTTGKRTTKKYSMTSGRNEMLQGFMITGYAFSLGVAVFIGAFIFLIFRIPVDAGAIGTSLLWIGALHLGAFLNDLLFRRGSPLAVAEVWVRQSLGRVFLLFLAVFVGIFVALWSNQAFFIPFMLLKFMADLEGPLEMLRRLFRRHSTISAD